MLEHLPIGTRDENWFQENDAIFTIPPETRRKHLAIFGATGAGKSTLLRNMIAWDIFSGVGVSVVDPHGQLVEDILGHHIPRRRTDDVIYFNPKDTAHAIPLNLLDSPAPEFDGLVVDNVLGIFVEFLCFSECTPTCFQVCQSRQIARQVVAIADAPTRLNANRSALLSRL